MKCLYRKDCLQVCLTRARALSPTRLLFGDEPGLVLLAVPLGGFVFHPLLREDWPWLLAVLALASLAHVWHWCCQDETALTRGAEREAP